MSEALDANLPFEITPRARLFSIRSTLDDAKRKVGELTMVLDVTEKRAMVAHSPTLVEATSKIQMYINTSAAAIDTAQELLSEIQLDASVDQTVKDDLATKVKLAKQAHNELMNRIMSNEMFETERRLST